MFPLHKYWIYSKLPPLWVNPGEPLINATHSHPVRLFPHHTRLVTSHTPEPNTSSAMPVPPNARMKPKDDLTEPIPDALSLPDLDGSEKDTQPKNVDHIGSYNLVDATKPRIIVPGQ